MGRYGENRWGANELMDVDISPQIKAQLGDLHFEIVRLNAIVEFLTKKNEDLRNEIRGYEQSSSKDGVCP